MKKGCVRKRARTLGKIKSGFLKEVAFILV
jgi:hypothetical protein